MSAFIPRRMRWRKSRRAIDWPWMISGLFFWIGLVGVLVGTIGFFLSGGRVLP